MATLKATLALNLETDLLSAALPLLQEGKVEALEWSFDALYQYRQVPDWFMALLETFSQEKRLLGHGIFFSLFSGKWSSEQQQWLNQLRQVARRLPFAHVTEHFGFMTGKNFHHGAPLNIPYTPATLAIGRDRLARIQEAAQCPVGLENLAFSYSLEEVKRHGEFLEKLVEPVNGFIILDLHNLYCQLHNFSLPFNDLIRWYPLDRVREIHISGGSWEASKAVPGQTVRRDTHDEAVPEEVFALLSQAIDLCPHLQFVVLEQLGNSLKSAESKTRFYQDFQRLQKILHLKNRRQVRQPDQVNSFLPFGPLISPEIIEDEALHRQQLELSAILETTPSYAHALHRLKASSLANSAWQIEAWEPYMLETAISLAQKWKKQEVT